MSPHSIGSEPAIIVARTDAHEKMIARTWGGSVDGLDGRAAMHRQPRAHWRDCPGRQTKTTTSKVEGGDPLPSYILLKTGHFFAFFHPLVLWFLKTTPPCSVST
jgi:hypothetical protein